MPCPELHSDHIRVAINEHILRITLDRPDKRNALTRTMYTDLEAAVSAGMADETVHVIVLEGEGEMFCAGNDIADFAGVDLSSGDAGVTGPALTFIRRMAECDKPIVVAVQGQATGIGTTLLLHADLVIAAEDARFYTAFIDLGLVPEAGSSLLLPRLLGRQNAARLLLAGETLSAAEAERMGLIAYRVPSAELAQRTQELAARLAAKPPGAMAASKRLMRQGMDSTALTGQIANEAEVFGQRLASDEVRDIMNAFLNRRKS